MDEKIGTMHTISAQNTTRLISFRNLTATSWALTPVLVKP